jgi:acyl-CoA synthetase (AMP-forming)/AMP-acid ligase II/thioesterase domain-containing protein
MLRTETAGAVCSATTHLQLDRWAMETPQAPAILFPTREPLTYVQLLEHLTRIGSVLSEAGVRSGEAVALVAAQGPELLTAFLAISSVGACAPLDPALTEEEYRTYLSRLKAGFLVIQEDVAPRAETVARELGLRVLPLRPRPDRATGLFDVILTHSEISPPRGRHTDAALLLFTSATTGQPKLVPLTWSNLQVMAANNVSSARLDQTDRYLNFMPLFHMHGIASVLIQLFCGGSVICTPGFEAGRFVSWFEEFRPTWFTGGPVFLRVILTLARQHPEIFRNSGLRFVRSSGAPAEPELLAAIEEAVHAPVVDGYGMTESPGITRNTPWARKPRSVGRSAGSEIAIVDDSGSPLPAGQEGEILLRGPAVMSGYLDDPDANHAAFRDGWFRTGDVGRLDSDGFLFITARLKEIINRGGQKIGPGEVDAALAKHPAVADVAAFGIPHRGLGEEIAAAVVLREGTAVSEKELRRFASENLAPAKVPRWILFADEIPRGNTGKPKRSDLANRYRDLARTNGDRPSGQRSAIDCRLIEIWKRVLGIPAVGLEDDFFRLGGDSLSAALMLTELKQELRSGAESLDDVDFFGEPTVASLSRTLSAAGAQFKEKDEADSPASRVIALQRRGSRLPIICLPASGLDPYYLRYLSKALGEEQPFYVIRTPEPVEDGRLRKVDELARLSIESMRSKRDTGPYLLAGHCFGGVIAFEMARQLLAEGQQVVRLVLFDVPAPGYPKLARNWKRYVVEMRRALGVMARGQRPLVEGEAVRHLRRLAQIVTRRFRGRASRAMAAAGSEALLADRSTKDLNGMALWEYVPRKLSVPMVQFIAADEPVSTKILDDPRLGWRDIAPGLEIRRVRGDHNSMLAGNHAAALAAELESFLEQAASPHARIATA